MIGGSEQQIGILVPDGDPVSVVELNLGWRRNGFGGYHYEDPILKFCDNNETPNFVREKFQSGIREWGPIEGRREYELASHLIDDLLSALNGDSWTINDAEWDRGHNRDISEPDIFAHWLVDKLRTERVRDLFFLLGRDAGLPVLRTLRTYIPTEPRDLLRMKFHIPSLGDDALGEKAGVIHSFLDISTGGVNCLIPTFQAHGLSEQKKVLDIAAENLAAVFKHVGFERYTDKETARKALEVAVETLGPIRKEIDKALIQTIGMPPKSTTSADDMSDDELYYSYAIAKFGDYIPRKYLMEELGSDGEKILEASKRTE